MRRRPCPINYSSMPPARNETARGRQFSPSTVLRLTAFSRPTPLFPFPEGWGKLPSLDGQLVFSPFPLGEGAGGRGLRIGEGISPGRIDILWTRGDPLPSHVSPPLADSCFSLTEFRQPILEPEHAISPSHAGCGPFPSRRNCRTIRTTPPEPCKESARFPIPAAQAGGRSGRTGGRPSIPRKGPPGF